MSHEGDGIKLRDLAKSSGDPKSPTTAIHLLWSRIGNQETARRSRKSYEFVLKSSSVVRLLTLLQQATMVPISNILRCPHHPGPPLTFPIRSYHCDQNFRPRASRRPTPLYFLIFEQNQSKVYREILIAGDLSEEDLGRAEALDVAFNVSQQRINFGLPVLTPYQGLWSEMGLSLIWQQQG